MDHRQSLADAWVADPVLARQVRRVSDGRLAAGWELLERLVNVDSPPDHRAGQDEVVSIMDSAWGDLGFERSWRRTDAGMPVLDVQRRVGAEAPTILVLLHLDTVFPVGTVAERPFQVQDGKALGPGVADMKGGAVSAMLAVASALEVTGGLPHLNLRILNNTDEEAGSVQSRPLIEEAGQDADLALVFEPGRPDGSIVTQRRGVRRFRLTVKGKPAHTGVEPWAGANANEELAHKVIALHALNDRDRFLSVTVSKMRGGAAINVIPEHAVAEVDARIPDLDTAEEVQRTVDTLASESVVAGTQTSYEIFADRPPLVPHPSVEGLLGGMRGAAEALGVEFRVTATGGGSDGCFLGPMDVPVLDALGPVGGGYHTPEEFMWADSLGERTALAGAFLAWLDAGLARRA